MMLEKLLFWSDDGSQAVLSDVFHVFSAMREIKSHSRLSFICKFICVCAIQTCAMKSSVILPAKITKESVIMWRHSCGLWLRAFICSWCFFSVKLGSVMLCFSLAFVVFCHCDLKPALSMQGLLQRWTGCLVWQGKSWGHDCVLRGPTGNDVFWWDIWWSLGTHCTDGIIDYTVVYRPVFLGEIHSSLDPLFYFIFYFLLAILPSLLTVTII